MASHWCQQLTSRGAALLGFVALASQAQQQNAPPVPAATSASQQQDTETNLSGIPIHLDKMNITGALTARPEDFKKSLYVTPQLSAEYARRANWSLLWSEFQASFRLQTPPAGGSSVEDTVRRLRLSGPDGDLKLELRFAGLLLNGNPGVMMGGSIEVGNQSAVSVMLQDGTQASSSGFGTFRGNVFTAIWLGPIYLGVQVTRNRAFGKDPDSIVAANYDLSTAITGYLYANIGQSSIQLKYLIECPKHMPFVSRCISGIPDAPASKASVEFSVGANFNPF